MRQQKQFTFLSLKLRRSSKAQITVFIIIGSLVLISFGITIYVGSQMKQPLQAAETIQQLEQIGVQPLQDYITTCLSLATINALNLIGRQGGVIYQTQGGLSSSRAATLEHTEGETYKISYLVIPPEGNVGPEGCTDNCLFYSEPPLYPFEGFPHVPGRDTPLFTGFYGISKLPPLYRSEQQTMPSIQENLEAYITRRTVQCADMSSFEEQGYTVVTQPITVELIFATAQEQFRGEQYITVDLTWPIDITTQKGDSIKLEKFTAREPVRLATIYYTIKQMIDADVTDVSYAPRDAGAFTVTIDPFNEYSFITVTDTQSSVNNEPFVFWVPRQNRRPALSALETNSIVVHNADTRKTILRIQGSTLIIDDPCPEPDAPREISLAAWDPDEDDITFTIDGEQAREIPDSWLGTTFSLMVSAKDSSNHPAEWFDTEQLQVQATICPVS